MKTTYINHLIQQYNTGKINAEEEQELEKAIELGYIELHQLEDLHTLDQKLELMLHTIPEQNMEQQFYAMLEREQAKQQPKNNSKLRPLFTQLSIAASLLFIGLAMGYLFFHPTEEREAIANLSDELKSMREMVMLSLIEKESSSERLKAVNLTQEMDQASEQVTSALLKTLNEDSNTNVRLAALESLYLYAEQAHVREGLIKSIQHQKSPLVQMALAKFMVSIQEKRSVQEFEELLKGARIPPPVKQQIKEELQVLL